LSEILVLGVGNLLLRDEGLGIHAIRSFEARFEVSSNVRVLDGGTAGVALLGSILSCDYLIVADAARMGSPAGTVARLEGASLSVCFAEKQSAHDWGLCEILLQAKLLGHAPSVVVIAAEPADIGQWDTALSPVLAARLPQVVDCLANEIGIAGGRVAPRLVACSTPA
jgi:hydrogenase maturation protease